MGIIKVYEHCRLPIIEFPIAIVACEMHEGRTRAFWEAHVFLYCNGIVSNSAPYFLRYRAADNQLLPEDTVELLFQNAFNYIESVVDQWQREEYIRIQAMHLLQPVRFVEASDRLLYRLWMGRTGEAEIRRIRNETQSLALRERLDRIMLLPQLHRDV